MLWDRPQGRGEGPVESVIALSFSTKFMSKIASSGGGRIKKWLKIASIDMRMVPIVISPYQKSPRAMGRVVNNFSTIDALYGSSRKQSDHYYCNSNCAKTIISSLMHMTIGRVGNNLSTIVATTIVLKY